MGEWFIRYAYVKSEHGNFQFLESVLMDCFNGFIEKNLELFKGRFLNEKCTPLSLELDWKNLRIFGQCVR